VPSRIRADQCVARGNLCPIVLRDLRDIYERLKIRVAPWLICKGFKMRAARLLGELEALAEKLGVEVVYERLPSCRSGLCRVNNQYLLFVDRALPEDAQVDVFISALSRFPLDDLQVLPFVREIFESQKI